MPTPTTSPPKPIETEAFGRLFRSRLEARCAVFLEAMGLRWEYEPEGFELPSGRYLPDFKVYDAEKLSGFYWLECKGGIPTGREVQLSRELSGATKAAVVFFSTALMDEIRRDYLGKKSCIESDGWEWGDGILNEDFYADGRRTGSTIGPQGWLQVWDFHTVVGFELSRMGFPDLDGVAPTWPTQKAFAAVNQALKARFEHGAGYA